MFKKIEGLVNIYIKKKEVVFGFLLAKYKTKNNFGIF